jgi:hypothetical protein
MAIHKHLTTFAGLPVREYKPGSKTRSHKRCAYRVAAWEFQEEKSHFPEVLDRFLEDHGGKELTTLVVGAYRYEDMVEGLGGQGAAEVVAALVANRGRMPNLRALFFGDITFDECEISWLHHGDLSPLLSAFPNLEELRVRGAAGLTFGRLRHGKLRSFSIESGGLPEALLQEVCAAELPKLEHLDLWLGTPDYGGISEVGPLQPLLTARRFRKLRYLGLRNSAIADKVAEEVAGASILERLQVLDLSLGNLTDAGAEALLRSSAVRKLKKLDLHHHFLSGPFVKQLKKLPLEVDVSDAQKPYFNESTDTTEAWRFNLVSE